MPEYIKTEVTKRVSPELPISKPFRCRVPSLVTPDDNGVRWIIGDDLNTPLDSDGFITIPETVSQFSVYRNYSSSKTMGADFQPLSSGTELIPVQYSADFVIGEDGKPTKFPDDPGNPSFKVP